MEKAKLFPVDASEESGGPLTATSKSPVHMCCVCLTKKKKRKREKEVRKYDADISQWHLYNLGHIVSYKTDTSNRVECVTLACAFHRFLVYRD